MAQEESPSVDATCVAGCAQTSFRRSASDGHVTLVGLPGLSMLLRRITHVFEQQRAALDCRLQNFEVHTSHVNCFCTFGCGSLARLPNVGVKA